MLDLSPYNDVPAVPAAASTAAALGAEVTLLYVAPASPRLYCPLLALTSGIGFAMMGVVFYRRFLLFAALLADYELVRFGWLR
jgi:hypothetical protein